MCTEVLLFLLVKGFTGFTIMSYSGEIIVKRHNGKLNDTLNLICYAANLMKEERRKKKEYFSEITLLNHLVGAN